jgi:hypothetical protein
MTTTKAAILLACGVIIGVSGVLFLPASVAEAQTGWQCRSWTLQKQEDAASVGSWLGQASAVHLAAAGLSQAGLSSVVACKR